jgi:hypothetical protein
MSIYASIQGDDPTYYWDGYGGEEMEKGAFLDVAVSVIAPRCRVSAYSPTTDEVILDPDGVRELIRRLQEALTRMNHGKETPA